MDNDFSSEEIKQIYQELEKTATENHELKQMLSSTNYQGNKDNNLIQFQLESSELLENIERYLRGDILRVDENGNTFYIKQEDESLVLLNEYGLNLIMSIIGQYIDKSTFLSFYTEERIYEILADLGDELRKCIFCNYDRMGLTTQFKKSRYQLIVLNILHKIESAYRRAIGGKEREEINSSRIYMQNDRGNLLDQTPSKKKFNFLRPFG